MSVFQKSELVKPSFFKKILGLQNKVNFLREIENTLADAEHGNGYRSVPMSLVLDLASKYKIKNISNYSISFKQYFSAVLKNSLLDEKLTDEELADLTHLKAIFNLSDEYVKNELENVTYEIYRQRVMKVISDGIITEDEKSALKSLQEDLKISKSEAEKILRKEIEEHKIEIYRNNVHDLISDKIINDEKRAKLQQIRETLLLSEETGKEIYSEEAQKIYQRLFDQVIADNRLSPDEDKQLEELAKNLNINVSFAEHTQRGLDKLRLFWKIENGDVPTISCDINIQKSEKLYFKTSITWYELRKETVRTTYSGLSYRSNLFGIKGLTYRNGTIAPKRITEDVLKPIDKGTLYLTNKRFIFTGRLGNKNINLSKVLSFEIFSDGVQIEKDSGKSPFFAFENDIDLFAVFLGRALKDC